MSISEQLRQKVRQNAKNRCEYCLSHQDYVMGRLQIDHIEPIVLGGEDREENLCLACELYATNTNGPKLKQSIQKQVRLLPYSILASKLGRNISLGVPITSQS